MSDQDQAEFEEILIIELDERVEELEEQISRSKKEPDNVNLKSDLLRTLHSIKGLFSLAGYPNISTTAHHFESIVVEGELSKNEQFLPMLTAFSDELDSLSSALKSSRTPDLGRFDHLTQQLASIDEFLINLGNQMNVTVFFNPSCTITSARSLVLIERIKQHAKITSYDPPLSDIREGLLTFKELVLGVTTQEDETTIRNLCIRVADVENVEIEKFMEIKADEGISAVTSDQLNIRVKLEDLDAIIQLLGDLVVYGQFIRETGGQDTYSRYSRENLLNFERTISNIQDLVIKMRLVPLESVLNRFPRMIRSISTEEGKLVDIIMSGKNIGVDRSIIEQLVDPLTHIMRNAVSHGIELPDERKALGKDKSGLILLSVSQEKSEIIIEIRDDGRGINYDLVKQKAAEKGYIEDDAELTTDEVHDILLNYEVSTQDQTSEISGRGVGLSSIKKSIDGIGGSIEIESEPNSFTTIKLILPLSVAISKILLLTIKDHQFAIPMGNIQQILSVPQDKFISSSSGVSLLIDKEPVPIINLRERFQFESLSEANSEQSSEVERAKEIVVLWQNRGQSLGFIVDDLLGEREVVIKPIHDFLRQIGAFSSATVLEGGQVVLIIDPTNFLEVSA